MGNTGLIWPKICRTTGGFE